MKKLLLTALIFTALTAVWGQSAKEKAKYAPKNVTVLAAIEEEIVVESGKSTNAALALLEKAQEKHGANIGIIHIEQSLKNSGDGKETWSVSAVVIRIKDEKYQALYDKTPKSGDRIYGAGSAKMASPKMSITTAETRARTELARLYNSAVEKSGETTLTTANAAIKGDRIEQIVFTPNGTVWIMLSVSKENISAE